MTKLAYYGYMENIIGNCGVSSIDGLSLEDDSWHSMYEIADAAGDENLGCGWVLSGFINNKTCRIAYERLMELYPCVYQSPVRKNKNSGKQFFFCIFDVRGT